MEESENILIMPETPSEIDPDWLCQMDCKEMSWLSKMDDPQMSSTITPLFVNPQIDDLREHSFYDFSFGDIKNLAQDLEVGSKEQSCVLSSDTEYFSHNDKRAEADDFIKNIMFEATNNSTLDLTADYATNESSLFNCDFLSNFLIDDIVQNDANDFLLEDDHCSVDIESSLSPPDFCRFQASGKVDGHNAFSSEISHPFISDFDTEDVFHVFDRQPGKMDICSPERNLNSDGCSPSDNSCTASMETTGLHSEQLEVGTELKTISVLAFNPVNLAYAGSSILHPEVRDALSNPEPKKGNAGLGDQSSVYGQLNDLKEKFSFKGEMMIDSMTHEREGKHSESCASSIDSSRLYCPGGEPRFSSQKRYAIVPLPSSLSHVSDLEPDLPPLNQTPINGESYDDGRVPAESLEEGISEVGPSVNKPILFCSRPDNSLLEACDEGFTEFVEAMPSDFSYLGNGQNDHLLSERLPCDQKSHTQSISETSTTQPDGDDFHISVDEAVDALTNIKGDNDLSAHNVQYFDVNAVASETIETPAKLTSTEENQFSDPIVYLPQTSPNRNQNHDSTAYVLPVGPVKNIRTLYKPAECTCPCVNVGMRDTFVCLRVRDMWKMNVKDILRLVDRGDSDRKTENEILKERRAEINLLLKSKEKRFLRGK